MISLDQLSKRYIVYEGRKWNDGLGTDENSNGYKRANEALLSVYIESTVHFKHISTKCNMRELHITELSSNEDILIFLVAPLSVRRLFFIYSCKYYTVNQ